MNVGLRKLAAGQHDIVAAWQLLAAGWSRKAIDHSVARWRWRVVHPGVYALTSSPLTRMQHWMAASLTAPETVLSHASAGACWDFRPWAGRLETVTRPGTGGPKQLGRVLVCRSSRLSDDVTRHHGIPITTAVRTLIDLARHLDDRATARMFREALRLKLTTAPKLLTSLAGRRGRPGTSLLLELAARYFTLPYERTRSDAEALALQLLHDAGIEPPLVNVRIRGEEADLVWPNRRLIIEIDGPQYHQFREEDGRKQARWEGAGYIVRRLPSGLVYDEPDRLIALVQRPTFI